MIENIIELGCLSLFAKANNCNEADNAEGAMILHLIIQTFGKDLNSRMWDVILKESIRKLKTDADAVNSNFLKARIMGIFIHCFMGNL